MQITIDVPDNLPTKRVLKKIKEVVNSFAREEKSLEMNKQKTKGMNKNIDPWDTLDIDEIAVDTGIEDFAENHDHYLYGTSNTGQLSA